MRRWWIAILCCLLPCLARAATPEAELDRVTTFLRSTYSGRKWDEGPVELKSESLRHSYPGLRFFVVWSNEPLPPGAPPPPDQRPTYGERVQQWQATHVTAVVRMRRDGALSVQKDLNEGLRRAKTQLDRQSACAAVFSLSAGSRAPPAVVEVGDVTIERSKTGWSCRFQQDPWFSGNAEFTSAGRCLTATRVSAAPMPPSAPPRPRP